MLRRTLRFGALVVVAGLLAACAGSRAVPAPAVPGAGPPLPPEPKWLATATADVQAIYRWAATHRDVLQYIPCYCNCGDTKSFRHKDNADCYFRETRGTWAWESHGAG